MNITFYLIQIISGTIDNIHIRHFFHKETHNRNRLTVGVISVARGYYFGTWEETVREQIAGALGEHGTWEEQLDWRSRNSGYDIVLQNDGRLVIPGEPDDGTFIVDVEDYDNVIVPLPLR
ncbi:hypothetical protein FACS189432_09130 [Bacteroidia bacterium]|nr:hypothetical protein FACS189432_09130 [Bacteroidia bacterium]